MYINEAAHSIRLKNLSDGRVRIIAEGDEEKMKLFEKAIDIKNTFIQVTTIEKIYSQPYGDSVVSINLLERGRQILAWMKELVY